MIYVFIVAAAYLVSVLIGYFGIRTMCKSNGWEADGVLVFVVFVPFVNVVWGIAGFFENGGANKFFRL